jgi:serine/threonine/tyrosine-interacting protein
MALSTTEHPNHHYTPTQVYSDKRDFHGPRINVPPPEINYRNGQPKLDVDVLPYNQTSLLYGNPGFLTELSSVTAAENLDLTHKMLSWKWDMRREAQFILPFMLLGPSSAMRDAKFIADNNITMVVAVRPRKAVQSRPAFLDPKTFASCANLATATLDFDDAREIIPLVRPVVKVINNHLEASSNIRPLTKLTDIRGRVLLFCESGNDRSALLAAAYLVAVFGIDPVTAINTVQSQRFCMTLSDDLKRTLVDLYDIVSAERQVSIFHEVMMTSARDQNNNLSINAQPTRTTKRSVDDFYDSDEDMMDDIEESRKTSDRKGVAPFMDSS